MLVDCNREGKSAIEGLVVVGGPVQHLHPPIDRSHTDCQLVGRLKTLTGTLIGSLDVISSDIFKTTYLSRLQILGPPLLSVDNVAPAQRDG